MDIAHHPLPLPLLSPFPLHPHSSSLVNTIAGPAPSPSVSTPCKAFPLPELDHPDFLAIDDLLDFCNDEIGGPIDPPISITATTTATATDSFSYSSPTTTATASTMTLPSKALPEPPVVAEKKQILSVFDSDGLCVPCDELAELEWLSNFVEESFSTVDTSNPNPVCTKPTIEGMQVSSTTKTRVVKEEESQGLEEEQEMKGNRATFHSTSPVSVLESSVNSREKATSFSPEMSIVPARARTKRSRTGVCFWNSRILSAEASESILETSSTTSTITMDSDMLPTTYYDDEDDEDDDNADENCINEEQEETNDSDHMHGDNDHINDDRVDKGPSLSHPQARRVEKKIHGKAKKSETNNKSKRVKVLEGPLVRKCLHCASQKTPQWRAGPLGPKTLCNACGVRYKSGRLCAEYRPASSPTFNETEHSNSHRRVLEMRRQRGEHISDPNNALVPYTSLR